jgi:hypothetical protein
MRISLKSFVAPVALACVLGIYGQAFAQAQQPARPDSPGQQAPRPDSPGQQAPARPDAPAQAQAATAQGELQDVDAKASTITVKTADSEMRFTYNDQTKVTGAQKGVAGLATMKGSQVTVQFRKDGATNIATSIEVRAKE